MHVEKYDRTPNFIQLIKVLDFKYQGQRFESSSTFSFDLGPFYKSKSTCRLEISLKWWQIWQTLLLSSTIMSNVGFRFTYLVLTLTYSKGQLCNGVSPNISAFLSISTNVCAQIPTMDKFDATAHACSNSAVTWLVVIRPLIVFCACDQHLGSYLIGCYPATDYLLRMRAANRQLPGWLLSSHWLSSTHACSDSVVTWLAVIQPVFLIGNQLCVQIVARCWVGVLKFVIDFVELHVSRICAKSRLRICLTSHILVLPIKVINWICWIVIKNLTFYGVLLLRNLLIFWS